MACPTCDRTMQGVGDGFFWCPSCGTLKSSRGSVPQFEVPSQNHLWPKLTEEETRHIADTLAFALDITDHIPTEDGSIWKSIAQKLQPFSARREETILEIVSRKVSDMKIKQVMLIEDSTPPEPRVPAPKNILVREGSEGKHFEKQ